MVHICAQMTSVQTLWPACALTPSEIYTCRPSNDEGFGQIVLSLSPPQAMQILHHASPRILSKKIENKPLFPPPSHD